jgi:hypothetical protein
MAPESDAQAAELESRAPESAELEPSGRRAVAEHRVDLSKLESLVDQLGALEPALVAMLVGTGLCMAHPLERISFMSEWATAPSVLRRRALARALGHPFSGPGVATTIDALVQDPDAIVRAAATQAALLRLGHDPDRYAAILERAEQRAFGSKSS